jgi:hypothetical protein
MTRLLVAITLVCGLSYALYPGECRIVVGRVGSSVRSVVAGAKGVVRQALAGDQTARRAAPAGPAQKAGAR